MRTRTLLVALLVIAPFALALVPAAEAAGTTRLVAFGDTSATSAAQKNVDGSIAEGAQGWLGLGDYNYDHSVSTWKAMFDPLLDRGAYLAIGNHDDRYALGSDVFPDGTRWAKSVGGARVVALNGMSAIDTTRLRSDLCNAPESIRIVIVHHNWWLTSAAHHPGSEFPTSASTMDAIMKDCGVDLVLAGHEHNYQRMVRNDIPYVIAGTGGRGIYPIAGSPSGTVATYAGYGRLVLDVSATGFSATFKALDGSVKDSFAKGTVSAPTAPTTSSGAVSFAPKAASEWWVETKVSGSPVAVASRDTGGAWVALSLRSWGAWAGSYHVEPGHQVQYRATLSDGRVVESCWYAGATCATSASSGFSVVWSGVSGNAWWVQAKATPTGGTVAKVDARVDGGAWQALTWESWGAWAKSIRAPVGSTVELRATSTTGAVAVSAKYAWPPG